MEPQVPAVSTTAYIPPQTPDVAPQSSGLDISLQHVDFYNPQITGYTPMNLAIPNMGTQTPAVADVNIQDKLNREFHKVASDAKLDPGPYNNPYETPLGQTLRYNDPELGGFSYDDPGNEYHYGNNQTLWDTFKARTLQFGGGLFSSYLGSFTDIPLLAGGAANLVTGDKDMLGNLMDSYRGLYDNSVSNTLAELDSSMKEAGTIYNTRFTEAHPIANILGDIYGSLGYSVGAIAGAISEDFLVGLATGGTAAVPLIGAQLTRAAIKIAKIFNGSEEAVNAFKTTLQSSKSVDRALKAADMVSGGVRNGLFKVNMVSNNFFEAGMEAKQAQSQTEMSLRAQKEQEVGRPLNEAELTEIYQKAGRAGNVAFGANVALLTATNYLEFGDLLKKVGKGIGVNTSFLDDIAQLNVRGGDPNIIEGVAREAVEAPTSRLGKLGAAAKRAIENPGKSAVVSASEAVEEGGQFAIGQGAEDYYTTKYGKPGQNWVTDAMKSALGGIKDTVTTEEGWINMIAGLGAGVVMAQGLKALKVNDKTDTSKLASYLSENKLTDILNTMPDLPLRAGQAATAAQLNAQSADAKSNYSKRTLADMQLFNWASAALETSRMDIRRDQLSEARKLEDGDFQRAFGIPYTPENKAAVNTKLNEIGRSLDTIELVHKRVNSLYTNPYRGNTPEQQVIRNQYDSYKRELTWQVFKQKNYRDEIAKMSTDLQTQFQGVSTDLLLNLSSRSGLLLYPEQTMNGMAVKELNKPGKEEGLVKVKEDYLDRKKELEKFIDDDIASPEDKKELATVEDRLVGIDMLLAGGINDPDDHAGEVMDILNDQQERNGSPYFSAADAKQMLAHGREMAQFKGSVDRATTMITSLATKGGFQKYMDMEFKAWTQARNEYLKGQVNNQSGEPIVSDSVYDYYTKNKETLSPTDKAGVLRAIAVKVKLGEKLTTREAEIYATYETEVNDLNNPKGAASLISDDVWLSMTDPNAPKLSPAVVKDITEKIQAKIDKGDALTDKELEFTKQYRLAFESLLKERAEAESAKVGAFPAQGEDYTGTINGKSGEFHVEGVHIKSNKILARFTPTGSILDETAEFSSEDWMARTGLPDSTNPELPPQPPPIDTPGQPPVPPVPPTTNQGQEDPSNTPFIHDLHTNYKVGDEFSVSGSPIIYEIVSFEPGQPMKVRYRNIDADDQESYYTIGLDAPLEPNGSSFHSLFDQGDIRRANSRGRITDAQWHEMDGQFDYDFLASWAASRGGQNLTGEAETPHTVLRIKLPQVVQDYLKAKADDNKKEIKRLANIPEVLRYREAIALKHDPYDKFIFENQEAGEALYEEVWKPRQVGVGSPHYGREKYVWDLSTPEDQLIQMGAKLGDKRFNLLQALKNILATDRSTPGERWLAKTLIPFVSPTQEVNIGTETKWNAKDGISINPDQFAKQYMGTAVLHELLHELTARQMGSYSLNVYTKEGTWDKDKSLQLKQDLERIRAYVIKRMEVSKPGSSNNYRGLDESLPVDEFLAEAMTNPALQRVLLDIQLPTQEPSRSLWREFIKVLLNALGIINTKNDVMTYVNNITMNAVLRNEWYGPIETEGLYFNPEYNFTFIKELSGSKMTDAVKDLNAKGKMTIENLLKNASVVVSAPSGGRVRAAGPQLVDGFNRIYRFNSSKVYEVVLDDKKIGVLHPYLSWSYLTRDDKGRLNDSKDPGALQPLHTIPRSEYVSVTGNPIESYDKFISLTQKLATMHEDLDKSTNLGSVLKLSSLSRYGFFELARPKFSREPEFAARKPISSFSDKFPVRDGKPVPFVLSMKKQWDETTQTFISSISEITGLDPNSKHYKAIKAAVDNNTQLLKLGSAPRYIVALRQPSATGINGPDDIVLTFAHPRSLTETELQSIVDQIKELSQQAIQDKGLDYKVLEDFHSNFYLADVATKLLDLNLTITSDGNLVFTAESRNKDIPKQTASVKAADLAGVTNIQQLINELNKVFLKKEIALLDPSHFKVNIPNDANVALSMITEALHSELSDELLMPQLYFRPADIDLVVPLGGQVQNQPAPQAQPEVTPEVQPTTEAVEAVVTTPGKRRRRSFEMTGFQEQEESVNDIEAPAESAPPVQATPTQLPSPNGKINTTPQVQDLENPDTSDFDYGTNDSISSRVAQYRRVCG